MSDVGTTDGIGSGDVVAPVEVGVPSESTAEEAPKRAGPPRRLAAKLTVLVLLVLAVSTVAFASQTSTGQRIVVNEVLSRLRAELAGELVVGEIRSPTLFAGLTLV